MDDLPLGRIAALVREFAVKGMPLGRTLMMMIQISLLLVLLILNLLRMPPVHLYDDKRALNSKP